MTKGGYRENAGRKSEWLSPGATRPIRVPELLADQILEIARRLDRGESAQIKVAHDDQEINKLPDLEKMIELANELIVSRKTKKQIAQEILSEFYQKPVDM